MNIFESNILVWIQENLRGVMDPFWVFITHLGDTGWLWIVMGLTLFAFKKTRPIGFAVLVSLLINLLITNIALKNIIARPRPFHVNEALSVLVKAPTSYSFPSGHTSGSLTAAFALYCYVPKKYGIPVNILAWMVALSRLYIGVHYPTDILGGVAVAVISSWLGCKVAKKVWAKLEAKTKDA